MWSRMTPTRIGFGVAASVWTMDVEKPETLNPNLFGIGPLVRRGSGLQTFSENVVACLAAVPQDTENLLQVYSGRLSWAMFMGIL